MIGFSKKVLYTFVIIFLLIPFGFLMAQSSDNTSPEISNVEVSEVTDDSITITWETDEEADSLVNFGLQPDLGIVRVPVADRKEHTIKLENLEPGRVYYFRVVSADENGNQGISADYKVQTSGEAVEGIGEGTGTSDSDSETESITPVSQTETTEEIIEQINNINDPELLQEIINEVVKAIQGITEDLTIVGPPTVIPETTTALVKWTTDRESTSEVLFSETNGFDGTNYSYSQSSTGETTTEHEIKTYWTDSFTDYSFKANPPTITELSVKVKTLHLKPKPQCLT
ncbi:MAG: fibronectin type III domain-containing protein [Candidatus Paceibacterota bacterium]